MREKNSYVLKEFPKLPKKETVIQNYRCTLKKNNSSHSGKLYITQNYFTFISNNLRLHHPFSDVSSIRQITAFWRFNAYISIELHSGQILNFYSFYSSHQAEAYEILQHLRKNTPTYFHVRSSSAPVHTDQLSTTAVELNNSSGLSSLDEARIERPDISLANECLDLTDSIYQDGLEIRGTLEENARTIDRVERNFLETDYHLLKAKRETDALESFGGQIKSAVLSITDKKLSPYEAPDRSAPSQTKQLFFDVPILVKHPNTDLESAVLRFGDKKMFCTELPKYKEGRTETMRIIRDYVYYYTQVSSVVLRVRPLHVDIRFNDSTPRFRCMTSFPQMIVNELVLRNSNVVVFFEHGVKQFSFGVESLRCHSLNPGGEDGENTQYFKRLSVRQSDLISESVPNLRNEMEEHDEVVSKLRHSISNIHVNMIDIEKETTRQTSQVSNMHRNLNTTAENAHKQNHRLIQLG